MRESRPGDRSTARTAMNRRAFLGSVGTGALVGVAGCGGGDGGDSGSGSNSTPEDAVSPTVVRGVERYDTTVVLTVMYSNPEFQYQRYSTLNPRGLNAILSFDLVGRSFGDDSVYGELVADWTYDSGTLEVTLHDDFRYWDGDPVDADNVLLHLALEDYALGTEDVDANPAIVDAERTGEYSIRFELADGWREEYALSRSIAGWSPKGSSSYYRPWLEDFEDAANDDEVEDVLRDLVNTSEGDPDPFYNAPFRIVDVHESRITCELRTDEEPVPHYVDDVNFTTLQIRMTNPDRQVELTDLFKRGWRPNARVEEVDLESVEFDTARAKFPPATGPWSILYNCSEPPTSNVRFRRAIAFMTDREIFMRATDVLPSERQTPFATRAREDRFVSDDVLAALEDYGWDGVMEDAADREMERGGFERDSDGRWIHDEGPRTGEPMELTLLASPAHGFVEERAQQFRDDLGEWGLALTVQTAREYFDRLARESGYTLAVANWGGWIPERTIEVNFAEQPENVAGWPRLPATVEAPPVGDPWPTADDVRSYDVHSMSRTLRRTDDDEEYRRLVDQLTWVYNQTNPRIGIEIAARESAFNTSRFDVRLPEDAPELWTRPPPRRLATNGSVQYRPPAER